MESIYGDDDDSLTENAHSSLKPLLHRALERYIEICNFINVDFLLSWAKNHSAVFSLTVCGILQFPI